MINKEQLTILHQGVKVWNQWREENPDEKIDLRGANLKRAKLACVNLNRTNLSDADLSGADLSKAELAGANLSEANLRRACLYNANLYNANLSGADLYNANLFKANLEKANLKNGLITAVNDVITMLQQATTTEDKEIFLDRGKRQTIFYCLSYLLDSQATSGRDLVADRIESFEEDFLTGASILSMMLVTIPFLIVIIFTYYVVKNLYKGLCYIADNVEFLYDSIHGLAYGVKASCIDVGIFSFTRKNAIEHLMQARSDHNYRIRWSVAYKLGELGRKEVISLLTQIIGNYKDTGAEKIASDYAVVCRIAAYALIKLGSGREMIELLTQASTDANAEMRWAAIFRLGEIGGENVITPLSEALRDADLGVRGAAVIGLGEIGGVKVIEPLGQALYDSYAEVRWVAKYTLRKIISEIHSVFFGDNHHNSQSQNADWCNPCVSEKTPALKALRRIVIDAETCDVQLIEKFMMYAMNAIGQKTLKKHVTVYIYGDLAQKHPNTYNLLATQSFKIITKPSLMIPPSKMRNS